jgi:hypothetical protein
MSRAELGCPHTGSARSRLHPPCPYRSTTCHARELACDLHHSQFETRSQVDVDPLHINTGHIPGEAIFR